MIAAYIVFALLISWVWVDYFRMIDIFHREKFPKIVAIFLLGASSVFLVVLAHKYVLNHVHFELNGNLLNDFLFATFRVGLLEELCKIVPFLVLFLCFRSTFKEPLDYVIYICISALGFSAAENVLYFKNNGSEIIIARSILSSVGHMFDTSLFAYGIILYQRKKSTASFLGIFGFILLAALSHGIYDFWLMQTVVPGGFIITILFFLLTISIFATILNNAINNSPHFNYNYHIDSWKVSKRLLLYYAIIFVGSSILNGFETGFKNILPLLLFSLYTAGIIVAVSCIRLSRFTLIRNHWFPLKLEFPFRLNALSIRTNTSGQRALEVKGDSSNDAFLSTYYQQQFTLHPLSGRTTYLNYPRTAYMTDKSLGKRGEVFFPIEVYTNGGNSLSEKMIMTSKKTGNTLFKDEYPIVGIYLVKELSSTNGKKKFRSEFREWAVVKPLNQ